MDFFQKLICGVFLLTTTNKQNKNTHPPRLVAICQQPADIRRF
jgi:hypothetical protein